MDIHTLLNVLFADPGGDFIIPLQCVIYSCLWEESLQGFISFPTVGAHTTYPAFLHEGDIDVRESQGTSFDDDFLKEEIPIGYYFDIFSIECVIKELSFYE